MIADVESGPGSAVAGSWLRRLRGFVFEPVPLARVDVLRRVIYLYVVLDVFAFTNDVIPHSESGPGLYQPLLLRRLLHLPIPDPVYAQTLRAVLVVCALALASGRLPRVATTVAGYVVAAGLLDWVSIGYSYSKIDHDHLPLIVAVWVLPSVGAIPVRRRERPGGSADRPGLGAGRVPARSQPRSEAAGWALTAIQLACVASYFLAACAKMRFGGPGWASGSVFAWAMVRRGTPIGRALLNPPWLLVASQWLLLGIEFCSPVILFLRGRARYATVALLVGFHLATFATLTISFLPLVICLLAFLPLEQIPERFTRA